MAISTSNIYQRNIDNFTRLSEKINDIQTQVSDGKKNLTLADDLIDIDNLNATEDHKAQLTRFNKNAIDVSSKMNYVDDVFEQLHNVATRLLELQTQTGNSFLTDDDRKLLGREAAAIKGEIFQLANQVDRNGSGVFSGLSGKNKPFLLDQNGIVSYSGAGTEKMVQVAPDTQLKQNFSGDDVFMNLGNADAKFSVFDAVDNFVESMDYSAGSEKSANLFSDGNSVELVFPEAGNATKFKFDFIEGVNSYSVDTTVYGNDYSAIATAINAHTGGTGVTATSNGTNKITLTSTKPDVKVENYSTDLAQQNSKSIGIRKTIGGATDDDYIIPHKLKHSEIGGQLTLVLDQFKLHRQDLSVTAKTAENYIDSTQETLVALTEDISDLKDADMAALLTQLQELLTTKEAAQATFTRITSKSLFDFLG